MRFLADLHLHSRFSRATSRDLDLEALYVAARRKGLTVVGTGDCTHGAWLAECADKLVEAEPGLYRLKPELERALDERVPAACRGPVRFLPTGEISTIYSAGGQVRKVHHVVLLPGLELAARFRAKLLKIGNLDSDGRPILGLDSHDLLEMLLELEGGAMLIPAHIWTPWFSVLGSRSGFDRIDECYRELTRYIYAVETGLSSDPEMNWTCSFLDRFVLVSNSDAHSPDKLGREANVFDCDLSWLAMRDALMNRREGRFQGTIEFFPEEGKYHLDGHRKCNVVLDPSETVKRNGVCPVCGKILTIGVMSRVYELSDREPGERPPEAYPFQRLVPLAEVLGQRLQVGAGSGRVAQALERLLSRLGPEVGILADVPVDEIARHDPVLATGIARMRRGEVRVRPGYDGEYGVIDVFDPAELSGLGGQADLLGGGSSKPRPVRALAPKPEALPLFGGTAPAPVATPAVEPVDAGQLGLALTVKPVRGGSTLDAAQKRAVTHASGPLLLHAGPGSGKTHTLVERVVHLVEKRGVRPDQVLAVTFTQRAAEELRVRLGRRLGAGAVGVTVETFHAFALRLVTDETGQAPQLLDDDEAIVLLRESLGRRDAAAARRTISLVKQQLADPEAGLPEYGIAGGPDTRALVEAYAAALAERGLCDLDDLVPRALALLADRAVAARWTARFPHVLVDEFQDVNRAQYELVRRLAPPATSRGTGVGAEVVAIGDPNQAIYRFRGADPAYFERFATDWPGCKRVRLKKNYRSSAEVVQAAEAALGAAAVRPGEPAASLAAEAVAGPSNVAVSVVTCATERSEAEFVAHTIEQLLGGVAHFSLDSGRSAGEATHVASFAEVAVLARTHEQAGPVADALCRLGLPVRRGGEARAWRSSDPVRQFLSFVRILSGQGRPFDFRTVVPPLGLPGGAVEDLPRVDRAALVALLKAHAPARLSALLEAEPAVVARAPAFDLLAAFLRLIEYRPASPNGTPATVFGAGDVDDPLRVLIEQVEGRPWTGADVAGRLRTLSDGDLVGTRGDRIQVLTLHAAKGLEWPVVFVLGCDDGWLPLQRPGQPLSDGDLAEERRLLYVGMTRARRQLYLLRARRRLRHGETVEPAPSRFLAPLAALANAVVTYLEPEGPKRTRSQQLTLL